MHLSLWRAGIPAAGHTSRQRNVAERQYKCMRQKAAVQDLNWDKNIENWQEASWSTKSGMGYRQKQQKYFGTTYYLELENRSMSHRAAKTSYLGGFGAKQNRYSSWGRRTLHVLLLATATCWPVGFLSINPPRSICTSCTKQMCLCAFPVAEWWHYCSMLFFERRFKQTFQKQ